MKDSGKGLVAAPQATGFTDIIWFQVELAAQEQPRSPCAHRAILSTPSVISSKPAAHV